MRLFQTNYHTHTTRCGHANGTDEEIVQAAINGGFKVLGFADHCPYPGVSPRVESVRIKLAETAGYFASLTELKERYRDQIEIHIGLEAEYLPGYFEQMLDYIKDYPYEYLILGQHFASADHGPYYAKIGNDAALLDLYVSQVFEALDTGRFLYLAHPDFPLWTGDPAILERQYRRICEGCLKRNVALEVNLLGYRQKRGYPNETFFRIAQETGNTLVLGVDAHAPEHFTDASMLAEFTAWAEQFGLPILDRFDLPLARS